MSKLIFMVGITAAGKSTYVKNHAKEDDVIASRDLVRFTLYDENNDFYSNESMVTHVFLYTIIQGLKNNKTVWVEAVNDTKHFRARILSRIEKFVKPDEIETIYLDAPLSLALSRNRSRGGPAQLDDELIVCMHKCLEPPTETEFAERGYTNIKITTIKENENGNY